MSNLEVVTPPVRLSFPALFEPRPVMKGSDDLKYMSTLLIPPSVDLTPFKNAIKAALVEKFGRLIQLPLRANPLKACADKQLDGYEDGWTYVNCKSKYRPGVVDQSLNEVMDPDMIYAGCWCRFHLTAYAWDHPVGGRGVSFSLESVQFVRDDERLDGRKSAVDVFEPIETGAVDESSPSDPEDDIFGAEVPF